MYKGPKQPFKRQPDNLNEGIKAREVFTVFPDGTTQTLATSAALKKAKEMNLDLVMISPNANPPVCKVIEYGHYKYEQKKKQKAAKKNQFIQLLKELKFR